MEFDIETFKHDFLKSIVKCYCEGADVSTTTIGKQSITGVLKFQKYESKIGNVGIYNLSATKPGDNGYASGDLIIFDMDNSVKIEEKKVTYSREEKVGIIFKKTRIIQEEKNIYKLVLSDETKDIIEKVKKFLNEMNVSMQFDLYNSENTTIIPQACFAYEMKAYNEKYCMDGPRYRKSLTGNGGSGIYEFAKNGEEINAKDVDGNVLDKFTIKFRNIGNDFGWNFYTYAAKYFGIEVNLGSSMDRLYAGMQELYSQIENL